MSGPFNVGDVVVCVDVSKRHGSAPDRKTALRLLAKGKIYKVDGVEYGDLHLAGVYPPNGWPYACERFRHLPRADDTFTAQMRALRPVKEPAL